MTSLTHRQAACAASVEAETMANVWPAIRAIETEQDRYETDAAYRAEQDVDWKWRNDAAQAPMDRRRDEHLARLFGEDQ